MARYIIISYNDYLLTEDVIQDLKENTPDELEWYENAIKILMELKQSEDITLLDFDELPDSFELQENTGYMLVGKVVWDFFVEKYHFGRGINYSVRNYKRIGTEIPGTYLMIREWIPFNPEDYVFFTSDEFLQLKYDLKPGIFVDNLEIALKYLDNLYYDANTRYGFDFETDGIFRKDNTVIRGFSIVSKNFRYYFDYEILGAYQEFNDKVLKLFSDKQQLISVYNYSFESSGTFEMFGKVFLFKDSRVIEILEGDNYIYSSLKVNVQKYFGGVPVWDADFELFLEYAEKLFTNPKVTLENFTKAKSYKKLISLFPEFESEIHDRLIKYWGRKYMIPPSKILGKYCCYDAYWTLVIIDYCYENYSELAIEIYTKNIQLGAYIEATGIPVDLKEREYQLERVKKGLSWSALHTTSLLLMIDLYNLSKRFDISSFKIESKILNSIIQHNYLRFTLYDTVKEIIWNCSTYDLEDNPYPSNFNESLLQEILIDENLVKDFMETIYGYVDFVEESLFRKRKVFSDLADILAEYIPEFFEISESEEIFENIIEYYNILSWIDIVNSKWKLACNRDSIDEKAFNYEFSEQLMSYRNFRSPKVQAEIRKEIKSIYPIEDLNRVFNIAYLMDESDEARDTLYDTFVNNYKSWDLSLEENKPFDIIDIEKFHKSEEELEAIKEEYQDFEDDVYPLNLNVMQGWLLKFDFRDMEKPFDIDITHPYFAFILETYLTFYKKYFKLSGYLEGLLTENLVTDLSVNRLGWSDFTKPGKVNKIHTPFYVCTVQSKRWASHAHTIYGKSDMKRVFASTEEDEGFLYFDISAAEPFTIGYKSEDPELLKTLESGKDIYLEFAKDVYIDHTEEELKNERGLIKTMYLGIFYGMEVPKFSEATGLSLEKAELILNNLKKKYSKAFNFVKERSEYPIKNDLNCKTIYGDKLFLPYTRDKSKLRRQGINQVIQNFAAVTLAAGFSNLTIEAYKQGFFLKPHFIVHDSFTASFKLKDILKLTSFVKNVFWDWVYETSKIRFKYDLEIGVNYYDKAILKVLSEDTISLKGNNYAIYLLITRLEKIFNIEYIDNTSLGEFEFDYWSLDHTFCDTGIIQSKYVISESNTVKLKLTNKGI